MDILNRARNLFNNFMTRVAKVDELSSIGSRFLIWFHHNLEWMRRPPIQEKSKVVGKIISAHQTERLIAYAEAGCRQEDSTSQKIAQLHIYKFDLLENLAKIKSLIDELETFAEDAANVMDSVFKNSQDVFIKKDDEPQSLPLLLVSDYRLVTGIIASMYKHDYTMQEKVILSLGINSLYEELESYCLMFELRPYINEEFMEDAWKHVP